MSQEYDRDRTVQYKNRKATLPKITSPDMVEVCEVREEYPYDSSPVVMENCVNNNLDETVNSSNNNQPITINVRPGLSNQISHNARFYRYLCQSINKMIQNINTHEQENSNQRSLL